MKRRERHRAHKKSDSSSDGTQCSFNCLSSGLGSTGAVVLPQPLAAPSRMRAVAFARQHQRHRQAHALRRKKILPVVNELFVRAPHQPDVSV